MFCLSPLNRKKENNAEVDKYYSYVSSLNSRFIYLVLQSKYFGLSTFSVQFVDEKNKIARPCLLFINQYFIIVNSLKTESEDLIPIDLQYNLSDINDVEMKQVNGQESVKITFKNNLAEINEDRNYNEFIISTDESDFIAQYIGDMLIQQEEDLIAQ